MTEYALQLSANNNYLVNCKRCALSRLNNNLELESKSKKQMKSINHRLSSRQKELFALRILASKIEPEKLLLDENCSLLASLALEIKCSSKALVNYLNKQLRKLTGNSQHSESAKKNAAAQKMIEDLQRLDKILAPNVCPFGERFMKINNKATIGDNIKLLSNLTNSF